MKIYFAGSIRGGRDDKDIYFEIIKLLSRYGTVLTEHIGDKNLSHAGEALESGDIYRRDMGWLTDSDVVVAEVTAPSLGVGYEIAKAEDMHKRILCLHRPVEGRRLSAMIEGSDTITKQEYKAVGELALMFDEFFNHKPIV